MSSVKISNKYHQSNKPMFFFTFFSTFSFLLGSRDNLDFILHLAADDSLYEYSDSPDYIFCVSVEDTKPEDHHYIQFATKISTFIDKVKDKVGNDPDCSLSDLKNLFSSDDLTVNGFKKDGDSKFALEFNSRGFKITATIGNDSNDRIMIFLPIEKSLFLNISSISENSTQKEVDDLMYLFHSTGEKEKLIATLMDLRGFFDNELFYGKFVLKTILKFDIRVYDANPYWQEFKQLDLVYSKIYYFDKNESEDPNISDVSSLRSLDFDLGLQTNCKNLLLDAPSDINLHQLCPVYLEYDNNPKINELVHNLVISPQSLRIFRNSKLPHIQTIWCDDESIPDDPILHNIFTFLKVIYLKNGDKYQKIPFENKFLKQKHKNINYKETVLTNMKFKHKRRCKTLTFIGVKIDNADLLKISKIIAPGCNLKFLNCDLSGIDFNNKPIHKSRQGQSKPVSWFDDIVPALSSIWLETLTVELCRTNPNFRNYWDEEIATKNIYIIDIPLEYHKTNSNAKCIHS